MARTNYFAARPECPHCHQLSAMVFDADIGALRNDLFQLGDLVIETPPPVPKRTGKSRLAVGPEGEVDWERPFWAIGLSECPACAREVTARIEIRDRRFSAARPTLEPLDLLAWGYLD